jgi:hypothetical protein
MYPSLVHCLHYAPFLFPLLKMVLSGFSVSYSYMLWKMHWPYSDSFTLVIYPPSLTSTLPLTWPVWCQLAPHNSFPNLTQFFHISPLLSNFHPICTNIRHVKKHDPLSIPQMTIHLSCSIFVLTSSSFLFSTNIFNSSFNVHIQIFQSLVLFFFGTTDTPNY